jgi:hypothetical protein
MCVFHSSQFTFMTRNQAAQPLNTPFTRRGRVTVIYAPPNGHAPVQ